MKSTLKASALMLASVAIAAQSSGLVEARNEMIAAVARQDKAGFARFLNDDITSIDSARAY